MGIDVIAPAAFGLIIACALAALVIHLSTGWKPLRRCYTCGKLRPYWGVHSRFDVNPFDYSIFKTICRKCVAEDKDRLPGYGKRKVGALVSQEMSYETYELIKTVFGLDYIERTVPRAAWSRSFKTYFVEEKLDGRKRIIP